MKNFLIEVSFNQSAGTYTAQYSNGTAVELSANNYHDAVLEADMIELYEHAD